MKKILLLLVLFSIKSIAQSPPTLPEDVKKDLYKKTEDSKSGNYKDILTSFFQLTTKNLTGTEKEISLNSTLFAIKANADPDYMKDVNFIKERFSRNFQFNFKLNLDDQYKYKGFTGGATYAIRNGRDRKLAVFSENYSKNYSEFMVIIEAIEDKLTENDDYDAEKLQAAINAVFNSETIPDTDTVAKFYYDEVLKRFKEKANVKSKILKTNAAEFVTALKELEKAEYDKVDARALWTLSTDGTANTEGKFSKGSLSSIFLLGGKAQKRELDLRAKLIYADTLMTSSMPRVEFKSTAGVNFKLYKNKHEVSVFETKIALEYNTILRNFLETEKKKTFLGNAEIRLRIADDLWIPLTVKYDLEDSNFLGFLNVTYNFDSVKK